MISGVWLEPESLNHVTAEKMNGWISDVFMGFHIDWDDPGAYTTKYSNDKGLKLCQDLHGLDPSVRFWPLLGDKAWKYEIAGKIDKVYKNGQFKDIANLVADKFSFLGSQLKGICIDWEGGDHTNLNPGDVQFMIKIYHQIRDAQPSLGLRIIPIDGVRKRLPEQNVGDFLDLDNAWMDFYIYNYGKISHARTLGCGCIGHDPDCSESYPHNCVNPDCNIDGTLDERTNYMHDHWICDDDARKFMDGLSPQQRGKITLATYPTTPQGIMAAYKNLWGKYHYYGYWMFDGEFAFNCSDDPSDEPFDEYRAVYKKIHDELAVNPPTYTQNVPWGC